MIFSSDNTGTFSKALRSLRILSILSTIPNELLGDEYKDYLNGKFDHSDVSLVINSLGGDCNQSSSLSLLSNLVNVGLLETDGLLFYKPTPFYFSGNIFKAVDNSNTRLYITKNRYKPE